MANEPIHPLINDLNRPFWEAAEHGRFVLPWCTKTEAYFWPPAPFSPFAFPGPVIWKDAKPNGVLLAIAIYRRPFQQAFAPLMPYGVGLAALDAGPRLQVHIAKPDGSDAPQVGGAVQIHFASVIAGGPKIPLARVMLPHT